MLMVAQSGSRDAEVLRLLCSRRKARLLSCISLRYDLMALFQFVEAFST
jgi:hypothetical protein